MCAWAKNNATIRILPGGRADAKALRSKGGSALGEVFEFKHQLFLGLLSAVSMAFRSSSDILGAAFFIIWMKQSISSAWPG